MLHPAMRRRPALLLLLTLALLAAAGPPMPPAAAQPDDRHGHRPAARQAEGPSDGKAQQAQDGSRIRRIGASDGPVAVAIALSQESFADGAAAGVVITRDDDFPDSLAGAALAGTTRPILYTPSGEGLHPDVAAEVRRVLGEPAGCADGRPAEVRILGSDAAVSAQAEADLVAAGWCTARVAGPTRVETAVAVADAVLAAPALGTPDHVLIARSDGWADSATGSAVAARRGLPLLVTPGDALHPEVRDWLADHPGIERATVLGGTAAVSDAVAEALAEVVDVDRVAGDARDATAAAIAEQLWDPDVRRGATLVEGYRADGWVFALASAVGAARRAAPQLYVRSTTAGQGFAQAPGVPASTAEALGEAHEGVVVGPITVISEGVLEEARAACLCEPLPIPGLVWFDNRRGIVFFDGVSEQVSREDLANTPVRVDISRDGGLVAVYDADAGVLHAGPVGGVGAVGSAEDLADAAGFTGPVEGCGGSPDQPVPPDAEIRYEVTALDVQSGDLAVRLEAEGTWGASGLALNGTDGIPGGRLLPGGSTTAGAVGGFVGRPAGCDDDVVDWWAAAMRDGRARLLQADDPERGSPITVHPSGAPVVTLEPTGEGEQELVWVGDSPSQPLIVGAGATFDTSWSGVLLFATTPGRSAFEVPIHPTFVTPGWAAVYEQTPQAGMPPIIPVSAMAPGGDGFAYFLGADPLTSRAVVHRFDPWSGAVERLDQSIQPSVTGGVLAIAAVGGV